MRQSFTRFVEWVSSTFGIFFDRFIAVGAIQSGVVLAAQTFMALIPLLMVVTAIFPPSFAATVTGWMRGRVGLSGSSEEMLQQLVASRDALLGSITVLGLLLVLVSATAFTRALQRMYEQAWALPHVRAGVRGVAWLVGLVAYIVIIGLGLRLAGGSPVGTAIRLVLAVVGAVLLWWWTPYVLLLGRVRLRSLLPGAVLTGLAMLVLGQISSIVVPRTIRSSQQQFGTIGVVFALQSWLVVVCCTIVVTAVIGAVSAQLDGTIGWLVRGSADLDGWRRSAASDTE